MTITTRHPKQTGITATGGFILLGTDDAVTFTAHLTAGAPVTGAKVQFTNDSKALIEAGTALWVDEIQGNSVVSYSGRGVGALTAIRLVATDGTWTFIVTEGS